MRENNLLINLSKNSATGDTRGIQLACGWILAGMRTSGVATLLCMAACGVESLEDPPLGETDRLLIQADRIVEQVDRIAPAIEHASRISVEINEESFHARSERLAITIPVKNSGWVELQRPGQELKYHLSVRLPFIETKKTGVIASDGTVTYHDGLPATDVAVQAFDNGVRIQTILNDENAPSKFNYAIDLPTDEHLVTNDNGGVLIFDDQGALRGGFAAPWAFDNKHQRVSTHYEVHGNTVIQIVEHTNATLEYPIVADPWLGFDLIANASWGWRDGGWTLFVLPTAWARTWGASDVSYSVGVAGWNELYSKYQSQGLNTNLVGMSEQFICHQQFAFWKSTWNLDEWRPNVGYAATVAALCNPGGAGD